MYSLPPDRVHRDGGVTQVLRPCATVPETQLHALVALIEVVVSRCLTDAGNNVEWNRPDADRARLVVIVHPLMPGCQRSIGKTLVHLESG